MIRAGCIVLLLLLAPHLGAATTVTEVHYVMGTYFRITAQHRDADAARAALRRCFTSTRDLESHFSRFDPGSELAQLNASDAPTVAVSDVMATLLQRSLHLRDATGGQFDVGIGALTTLWRTSADWPTLLQLMTARATIGGDALQLQDHTLIRRPGVRLDFDGVAKGFAADRCAMQLRDAGITQALLNFGESSWYALGSPMGRRSWTVAVRSLAPDRLLGTLRLRNQAASISAVFGHERLIGSRRVGHIVNPHTGEPLTTRAMAVVVAPSATDAEAFSKALLIESAGFVSRHPYQGGPQGVASQMRDLPLPPSLVRRGNLLMTGALLIHPHNIRRLGTIAFTRFRNPPRISVAAEPLQ